MNAKEIRDALKSAESVGKNLYMKASRPPSMPEHWFRVVGAKLERGMLLVKVLPSGGFVPVAKDAIFDAR